MVLGVSHGHKVRPLFPPGGCATSYSNLSGSWEKGRSALPSLGTTAHVTIGGAHSADHLVHCLDLHSGLVYLLSYRHC